MGSIGVLWGTARYTRGSCGVLKRPRGTRGVLKATSGEYYAIRSVVERHAAGCWWGSGGVLAGYRWNFGGWWRGAEV